MKSYYVIRKKKNQSSGAIVLIIFLIILSVVGFYEYMNYSSCSNRNGVFNGLWCREKTLDELFREQCTGGIKYTDGKVFTCNEIAQRGLKGAYLREDGITRHGDQIYESGTAVEVSEGKKSHDYCLETSEAWTHYYETTCVILYYEYIACGGGHCYIDEKKNYKSGFVAFFPTNYSWNSFRDTFEDQSPVMVCGYIEPYQGHPQIKVTNPNGQVFLNPTPYNDGAYKVYKNTCRH